LNLRTNTREIEMKSIRWAVAGLALCVLAACGGGGGGTAVTPVVVPPAAVSWALKTANHGVVSTARTGLAVIGNTLYMAGSSFVTPNYLPQLYQSTDAGVTWTNTNTPPPGFTSLFGFRIVSDGTALYLIGGRTSDSTVTVATSKTYNNSVLKFTPGSPAGTWTTVAVNPFINGTTAGGREDMAVAWDGSSLYAHGGTRLNSALTGTIVSNAVFRSSDRGVTWTWVNNSSSYAISGHCLMSSSAGVLYSAGGVGYTSSTSAFGDMTQVLKSTDGGTSWTPLASPQPIPGFAFMPSCASLNGRLYVLGGMTGTTTANSYTSAIWQSSDNGITWFNDVASALFGPRAFHGTTGFNGKLVVFGGQDANGAYRTDVLEGTP
jgi:hypothetical protein